MCGIHSKEVCPSVLLLPPRAEEQLVRINQVFQDVLKGEETRALYNQLCHFRQVMVTTLFVGPVIQQTSLIS